MDASERRIDRRATAAALTLGYDTSVEQDPETNEWTCVCARQLVPSLDAVVAAEDELDELGREVGGYGDGFGTFGNADTTQR